MRFPAACLFFLLWLIFCLPSSYSFSNIPVNFFASGNYPHLNYRNETVFKRAFENYLRGKYKKAAGQFWLYTLSGKILKNYALYYEGLSLFKIKEYHKANYVFILLTKSFPNFIFYKNAVFYLALSESRNGYYSSEISDFKYIIKHSKKSAVRSYAMFKIYKADLRLKNHASANNYLLRIYLNYPYFSKIHKIKFNEKDMSEPEKIKRGMDLYYDSYYAESLGLLKNIARKNAVAEFIILKDLMKIKSPAFIEKADKCLTGGGECGGVKKLKILTLKARYYYTLDKRRQTLSVLNFIAGKYGFLDGRLNKIYRALVWRGVLNDLKNEKMFNAAKRLKSFFIIDDGVNGETAKFLFWYGVVLEKLGYKNRASFYFNILKMSKVLRYSYYGIMSGIEMNKISGVNNFKGGSKTEELNKLEIAVYNEGYLNSGSGFKEMLKKNRSLKLNFKRLKALLNLKLYYLSDIEINRLIPLIRNKKTAAFLAYMLYRNKNYGAAINFISNFIHSYKFRFLILNAGFLKILYPRPYFGYVKKYAYRYGTPVNLIYGVMRQESLYNPVCYSSASAIGLMQIIPSTGYYIARRTGCYSFNPSMLYRKNINISFGSYYLKTLLNMFNGRKYLAIASYNAGPGAVAYWKNFLLKDYAMPLFIELIPFNQTRNYVKRVLANYYVYNALY